MTHVCPQCHRDTGSSYCADCHHATQPVNERPERCTYHERDNVKCVPAAPSLDYAALSDLLHVARQTASLFSYSVKSFPVGWLCPACHKVNAPEVKQCPCDCGECV
jgi:hypothetical protein